MYIQTRMYSAEHSKVNQNQKLPASAMAVFSVLKLQWLGMDNLYENETPKSFTQILGDATFVATIH